MARRKNVGSIAQYVGRFAFQQWGNRQLLPWKGGIKKEREKDPTKITHIVIVHDISDLTHPL